MFHLYLIWNETNKSGETAFYALSNYIRFRNSKQLRGIAIFCRIPQCTEADEKHWIETSHCKNQMEYYH